MKKLKLVKNLSPFFEKLYKQNIKEIHLCFLKILSVLGVLNFYLYQCILEGKEYILITAIFFSLFILILVSYLFNIKDRKVIRIIPYFDKRLTKEYNSFFYGNFVFWQSKDIDFLLKEKGFNIFSNYISLDKDENKWYSPFEILPSLGYLISHFQRLPEEIKLLKDLEILRTSLEQAKSDNILFCFHCRFGSSTSAQEHEELKGSYF